MPTYTPYNDLLSAASQLEAAEISFRQHPSGFRGRQNEWFIAIDGSAARHRCSAARTSGIIRRDENLR